MSFRITAGLLFSRKLLYFNDLTSNPICDLLNFKKSNILTLKGNRNCHSSKNWASQSIVLERFRRKLFLIDVFNLNWMFLQVIFQYLIFLIGKVIETITVQENGFFHLIFWRIETKVWMVFSKKFFFQWFCYCLNVLAVKILISQCFYGKIK